MNKRRGITETPRLSRELDRATAALEAAIDAGDRARADYARAWVRKLECEIFGETRERVPDSVV